MTQGSAHEGAGTAARVGYGLAQYGAGWDSAQAVLVLVHGRDREPEEMFRLLGDSLAARLRVLAPYTESKTWYPGRYDAPLAENAEGVARGMDEIDAAFRLAAEHGFGPERVVLAGFSQGGCLVTEYLIDGRTRPAAAAIFTGTPLAMTGRGLPERDLAELPVVVSGGAADAWLPLADLLATEAVLTRLGASVHLEMFPDADHVVRPAEINRLRELVDQLTP
ncbi:alpha/beta hydrolase [Pseudoroseicyclus tamaricis]|uniref:Phospholipase/carboxylesterase/thioesterase domain-containing protein n=1 Tax=Pseudoroseicyclus tamaricis TaxID=2705421 RepID=A0A6B2JWD9_9RHOB|nr:dienelactone hydrolase family protein [Pseudoroseicyclus tamaricis]NDV02817.1 hypothetical protein [Pseudoroseicyclus tamaricis]